MAMSMHNHSEDTISLSFTPPSISVTHPMFKQTGFASSKVVWISKEFDSSEELFFCAEVQTDWSGNVATDSRGLQARRWMVQSRILATKYSLYNFVTVCW